MIRTILRSVLLLLLCLIMGFAAIAGRLARREEKLYTADELEAVFSERRDEYCAVADMFLENGKLDELMSASSDRVLLIDVPFVERTLASEELSGCFTDEQRELILRLFRETGMTRLEYNARTKPEHVRFIYGGSSGHATLYCLCAEDGAEAFFHNMEKASCKFYQIEEGWFVEHFTEAHFMESIKSRVYRR